MGQIQTVIDYAVSQVGYKETPTNITKYAAEIDRDFSGFYNGKKQGAAWCDIFVDYCFLHCFGEEQALYLLCQPKRSTGAGCRFSAQFYKDAKRYYKDPEIGDQIFFFDNYHEINHTGLVVGVDNSKVYTVEGNSGNEVKRHSYARNNLKIAGYGRPRYNDVQAADPAPIKTIDEVARDVISGKYGNDPERSRRLTAEGYDAKAVQNRVNELLGIKPKNNTASDSWVGIVATQRDPLNVRKVPNGTIIRTLPKGSEIRLTGVNMGGWYKLADGSGYVSAKFIIRK